MKIVQISDTHLSPLKSHFNDNWEPLRAWIEAVAPDLVIHTGDVTIDGADHEDDKIEGPGSRFSTSLVNYYSCNELY